MIPKFKEDIKIKSFLKHPFSFDINKEIGTGNV